MTEKKKSYYTSRADVVPTRHNPWAGELAHTIKKGHKVTGFATSKHSLVNQATGEVSDDIALVGVRKVVDKEEFIKFFGAGIMEVFELTTPAKDVFKAILNVYLDQKNQAEQLYLNYDEIKEIYGYSKSPSTYYNGLNELIVKGFLAPVQFRESHFWVNPNLFYKGDRIRIVREYVRAGTKAAKQVEKENAAMNQMGLPLDAPADHD